MKHLTRAIVLLLLCVILLSFTVNAVVTTDDIMWGYELEGVVSTNGSYGLTNNGVVFDAGKNGNGATLTSGDYLLNTTTGPTWNSFESVSISVWFKIDLTDVSTQACIMMVADLGDSGMRMCQEAGGTWTTRWGWQLDYGGGQNFGLTGNDVWHHMVYTRNSTRQAMYIDTQLVEDIATGVQSNNGNNFVIGGLATLAGYWFIGQIDEFMVWDKTLTLAEVIQINDTYYSNNFAAAPTPTINFLNRNPANGTIINSSRFEFVSFNITDMTGGSTTCDLHLWANDTYQGITTTFTTVLENTNRNATQTLGGNAEKVIKMSLDCGTEGWSENNTIIIDTASPTISTAFTNATTSLYNISGNFTFTDGNLHSASIMIDNLYSVLNVTNLTGTEFIYRLNYSITNLSVGEHALNVRAADGHTAKNLKGTYTYPSISTDTIRFGLYDNHWMEIIEVDNKGMFKTTQKYDRVEYAFIPMDKTKNKYEFIVSTDQYIQIMHRQNTDYVDWLIFGEHWQDFYMPTEENHKITYTRINTTAVSVEVKGMKDKEVLTFSSVGDLNIANINYTFYRMNVTAYNDREVTNGELQTIYAVFETGGAPIDVSAVLVYNNTVKNTTKTNLTAGFNFSVTFSTPFTTNRDYENRSILWNFTYAGGNKTSLTDHQAVLPLIADNCTTANATAVNFTVWHEDFPTTVNLPVDADISITYWALGNKGINTSYNGTLARGENSFLLCIYPPGQTILADAYLKYTHSTGFTHRHFLTNQTITNSTTFIDLYNFNYTTGISDLSVTIRNVATYAIYPSVIGKLQRNYLNEDIWRTVQMDKSGDFGLIFYNVIEETTDYRMSFYDIEGNVLKTTQPSKFVCTSGICSLTELLSAFTGTTTDDSVTGSAIYSNTTGVITTIYNVKDGSSQTLSYKVARITASNPETVCSDSSTGAAGSFTCNVSLITSTLMVTMTDDAGGVVVREYIEPYNNDTLALAIGAGGTDDVGFLSAGILITIAMIGAYEPIAGIIMAMFAIVFIYLSGLFGPISYPFVISAIVIGLGMAYLIRQRK